MSNNSQSYVGVGDVPKFKSIHTIWLYDDRTGIIKYRKKTFICEGALEPSITDLEKNTMRSVEQQGIDTKNLKIIRPEGIDDVANYIVDLDNKVLVRISDNVTIQEKESS